MGVGGCVVPATGGVVSVKRGGDSAGQPYIYVLTGLLDFLSERVVESYVLADTVDNLASKLE